MTALNDAKFARGVNSKTSRPTSLRINFHKKQETINQHEAAIISQRHYNYNIT